MSAENRIDESAGTDAPGAGAEAAAQFYTGLVADLYEPLASEAARAEDYAPRLRRGGGPALELGCGSGRPLLDLLEMGFDVEGLDASADMLERCRHSASQRGLAVTLHHAPMQDFSLPRRYRSIFLAGASFTLLITDRDAERALSCARAHLEPGGSMLIPLEMPDVPALRSTIGRRREVRDGSASMAVSLTEVTESPDGRTVRCRLRYERQIDGREPEVEERDWQRRFWTQPQFERLAGAAGFTKVRFLAPSAGRASADATQFVALATP